MSEELLSDVTFSSLDLPPPLQEGVQNAGFEFCTAIQAKSLPSALAGEDVAGQAQTGTGKTAAFLLATLNRLLLESPSDDYQDGEPRAVILAPTRELAIQIFRDGEVLARPTDLRLGVVYGGEGYDSQREMLKAGLDILIGTPGRMIDYFKQGVYKLKSVQVVVLDEADRMFDLGFIKDIRYLLRRMPRPQDRLNMLFSATLSMRVMELAYEHMNDPTEVKVESETVTADRVTQVLYHLESETKISLLVGMLKSIDPHRTLVFINTKRTAERVRDFLVGNDIKAEVLSGDVPQRKRGKLLESFKKGDLPVLVATDVAARGLHIPGVSHVFNFDLPQDAEDYVHRIGRTARAGSSGDAVSFACERYVYSLGEIEDFIGNKIPVEPVPDELMVKLKPPVRVERRPRHENRGRHGEHKTQRPRRRPGQGRGHSHKTSS